MAADNGSVYLWSLDGRLVVYNVYLFYKYVIGLCIVCV